MRIQHPSGRKRPFRLNAPYIKHIPLAGGVWDLYEEEPPTKKRSNNIWFLRLPGSQTFEWYKEMVSALPYIWRMVQDVASIRSIWFPFILFITLKVIESLLPAVTLWYTGQLIQVVQRAVEERVVDKPLMFRIAVIRVACSIFARIFSYYRIRIATQLDQRIRLHYSVYLFHSNARLDVPTFDDPQVQQQLKQATPSRSRHSSIAWECIQALTNLSAVILQHGSQASVMLAVLREHDDGPLLAFMSLASAFFKWNQDVKNFRAYTGTGHAWAATCRNEDYIRVEGLKLTITDRSHRKEIVAGGNMWSFLLSEYRGAIERLGENAVDFWTAFQDYKITRLTMGAFFGDALQQAPQIAFTLNAVRHPASVPVSLATLHLITDTTERSAYQMLQLWDDTRNVAESFASVKKLYEAVSIPNKVQDGKISYPEDTQAVKSGISLEFRNVSFQYPGAVKLALRNVSFFVDKGQLCVIVGSNGSGKSTILKLIMRMYDPQEGEIYIDGQDIRSLSLEDLRMAIACLFQDYTHFPLSIKENIGLGDPSYAHDIDRIKTAAALGGADSVIENLPEGYDTYLQRPVSDHYAGLPNGTTSLFGRTVDADETFGPVSNATVTELSGGEMQRIALSRCFMKSFAEDQKHQVGMLLFDEPSASLDPKAEHDLFQRLRKLRGQKTMLFSSHRFGSLTKHADIILYMDEAGIRESGTHDELLLKQGSYAEIWNISVSSFIN